MPTAKSITGQHCRLLHNRATMRVKFEATDATGKVHKRSSMSHIRWRKERRVEAIEILEAGAVAGVVGN